MTPNSCHVAGCLMLLTLAGCAAPPLTLYTLSDEAPAVPPGPLGAHPRIIEVARVSMPDDLDNDDIIVRNGNVLQRSTKGRWASRLSLEITALIARRLAELHPGDWVTDVHQPATPADRVLITISTLDLTTDGRASLVARWLIIPQDTGAPTVRNRAQYSRTFPVSSDRDVVVMETELVKELANDIRLP